MELDTGSVSIYQGRHVSPPQTTEGRLGSLDLGKRGGHLSGNVPQGTKGQGALKSTALCLLSDEMT